MKKNDELVLSTASGLSADGAAVSRVPDGRIVFVRGAAPNENVRARLSHVSKRFLRADLLEVLAPGPDRVVRPCAYAQSCGGCALMHIQPDVVRDAKVAGGTETLHRVGRVPKSLGPQQPAPALPLYGYRTRARLAVDADGLGYRQAQSNRLVHISHCLVLHPLLQQARDRIESLIHQYGGSRPVDGEIRLSTNGEEVSVDLPPSLAFLAPKLQAVDGLSVDDPLTYEDRWVLMLLRASIFAQSSLQGNELLLAEVEKRLPEGGALALELYAGSGNFTRLLAKHFSQVVAVELEQSAVKLGKQLGLPNVEWMCTASSGQVLRGQKPSLVLMNPPRSGVEAHVLAELQGLHPEAVVYISCHVGSLARDLGKLQDMGFSVQTVAAFDIYPATPHVEWVVSLSGPSTR